MQGQSPFDLLSRRGDVMDNPGPITEAEKREILAKLRTMLAADRSMSHAKIATNIGCSASVVSQIMGGKYGGSTDKYLARARQWLAARDMGQVDQAESRFVGTTIGKSVVQVCLRTWRLGKMARVVLPAGAGKTQALLEVKRRYGRHVLYVQAHQAGSTITGMLRAVARAAGISVSRNDSSDEIYEKIRDLLTTWRQTDERLSALILLDEATALSGRALNYVRQFHDDQAMRAAVVLADTEDLASMLASRRKLPGGYAQLRSRMAFSYPSPSASLEQLITRDDAVAVALEVMRACGHERAKVNADAAKFLHAMALDDGTLRNVEQRVTAVAAIAEECEIEPTWTVAELDYAGLLLGQPTRGRYRTPPFGRQVDSDETRPARMAG